jgi:hypothetical protein
MRGLARAGGHYSRLILRVPDWLDGSLVLTGCWGFLWLRRLRRGLPLGRGRRGGHCSSILGGERLGDGHGRALAGAGILRQWLGWRRRGCCWRRLMLAGRRCRLRAPDVRLRNLRKLRGNTGSLRVSTRSLNVTSRPLSVSTRSLRMDAGPLRVDAGPLGLKARP